MIDNDPEVTVNDWHLVSLGPRTLVLSFLFLSLSSARALQGNKGEEERELKVQQHVDIRLLSSPWREWLSLLLSLPFLTATHSQGEGKEDMDVANYLFLFPLGGDGGRVNCQKTFITSSSTPAQGNIEK